MNPHGSDLVDLVRCISKVIRTLAYIRFLDPFRMQLFEANVSRRIQPVQAFLLIWRAAFVVSSRSRTRHLQWSHADLCL